MQSRDTRLTKQASYQFFFSSRKLAMFTLNVIFLLVISSRQGWSQAPAASSTKPRLEKDLLGQKEVPGDAYYGVQTARALENFQISGVLINHYPKFIDAWAYVKLAAAQANTDV